MEVFLNGQVHEVDELITIAGLLQKLGLNKRRIAVEVNREIIAQSLHTTHCLQAGDRIEIVQAIGGG